MAWPQPLRRLQPFSPQPLLDRFHLEAAADWSNGSLRLMFRLQGPLQQLCLPFSTTAAERRDGLWQSTCFEAFVAVPGQAAYWEINICPSGHWNVYALSAYRQGLQAELSVQQLPFALRRDLQAGGGELLELGLTVPLAPLSRAIAQLPAAGLELSATAVLEHQQLGCSYWAWQHCGPEADFHRRDSFLPL